MSFDTASANRFKLVLTGDRFRDNQFELGIQQVNLPGMTMGTITQPTPIRNIYRPGDSLEHMELVVNFSVSEDYREWVEIFDWIMEMKDSSTINMKEVYCDAVLMILTNKFNPLMGFKFENAFPYMLGDVQLDTTIDSAEVLTSTVSFKFHDMKKIEVV